MNDKNSPGDESLTPSKSNPLVTVLALAVLGLGVGAGLYAYLGGDSKPETSLASADSSTSCALDDTLRAKLDANAGGDVASFKALDRPYSVADLKFNDAEGKPLSMADWNGKTVLFNLWATWCAPCRAEMPALESLNRDIGGESFEVVPVSIDQGEADKPKRFYEEIGLKDVRFFHDPELSTFNSLKRNGLAFGLPATLLVSKQGCVLGTLNGPAEWGGEDAKKLVRTAL